jgi:serine/threonine protein kinase
MKSILTGLAYIHECKITHRDLAKDNILWNPVKEEAVIIDFDTSCFYRPQGYFRDVGRDKYDAPEKTSVIEIRRKLWESSRKKPKSKRRLKPYTEKADMYSLGVLFWMLINDKHHSPSPYKLKRWINKVKQRRKQKKYPELDLLVKMLAFDPDRRITPADALNHPFITEVKTDSSDHADYVEMRKYLLKMLDMQDKLEDLFDDNGKSDDDEDDDVHDSDIPSDADDDDLEFTESSDESDESENESEDEDDTHEEPSVSAVDTVEVKSEPTPSPVEPTPDP